MVCVRCKMVVKEELKKMGLHFVVVDLGEIDIMETISDDQRVELNSALMVSGLELMDDKKSMLIEKIKNIIVEVVYNSEEALKVNLSDHISTKLNHDYTYLANLFSEVQGSTIENFYISHKIERVKELLVYDELSLTEIAYKLNYSSVAHLSNQFKKNAGLSPSHFKLLKDKTRGSIVDIGEIKSIT